MATTTDYINQLKTDKTNLVNNLIEKGASAAQDETFTSLVPKVLDIETGITPTGTINITENGTYDVTDKASANVNVEGLKGTTIEITKNGTYIPEEPYNAFTEVKANVESDPSVYFGDKFIKGDANNSNSNLYKIIKRLPLLAIEGTNADFMFAYCTSLIEVPQLDTSNITSMLGTFKYCNSLIEGPLLDTSKVTNFNNIFYNCPNLESIPMLNASRVTSIYYPFLCVNLMNFGGFQNLGQAYLTTANANYNLYKLVLLDSTKLTHDSLMNVINNLYDIATKGVKTQQLVLGSTNLAKLTAEEIAIATNKGWSVS